MREGRDHGNRDRHPHSGKQQCGGQGAFDLSPLGRKTTFTEDDDQCGEAQRVSEAGIIEFQPQLTDEDAETQEQQQRGQTKTGA